LLKRRRMVTFWGESGGKPIARKSENRVTRVLEPGGKGAPEGDRKRAFPIQTGTSSELNHEYRFGAPGCRLLRAKVNIIRYLFDS